MIFHGNEISVFAIYACLLIGVMNGGRALNDDCHSIRMQMRGEDHEIRRYAKKDR